jgi:hypothetical protein
MFTIIKNEIEKSTNTSQEEMILNIIYGDNEDYIKKWISLYFDNIIGKKEKLDSEEFFVEIEEGIYYLVKKTNIIVKGYIFNTPQQITEKLFSVRYLKFDDNKEKALLKTLSDNIKLNELNGLFPEITNEINHKVLEGIDRESLYEIYCAFEGAIRTKETWNTTELVILQNKVTREFKKDLYSTIVKKSKKAANKLKKKSPTNSESSSGSSSPVLLPCKTIMINEMNEIEGCGVVDLSKWNSNACSLEYTILNKDK